MPSVVAELGRVCWSAACRGMFLVGDAGEHGYRLGGIFGSGGEDAKFELCIRGGALSFAAAWDSRARGDADEHVDGLLGIFGSGGEDAKFELCIRW